MFEGYIFYAAVTFLVFLITWLGVMGYRFRFQIHIIVVAFLLFLPTTYMASVDLLSRPRPVELMLSFMQPNPKEARILAVHMVEGKYIMLLLDWDGLDYPRYFRWAWDQQMAEQIQGAVNEAKSNKSKGVLMKHPFDNSLERRRNPWANPMPQENIDDPDKRAPKQKVFHFERITQ